MSWWWLRQFEQAFDEAIQELDVDMDKACYDGTYPKARDHLVDAVEAIVLRMQEDSKENRKFYESGRNVALNLWRKNQLTINAIKHSLTHCQTCELCHGLLKECAFNLLAGELGIPQKGEWDDDDVR